MTDEAKKIVTQLRLYAKQYADPTSFWKVILGTEEILRGAADFIERLSAESESDERRYGRDAFRAIVDEAMKFEQERDAWRFRAEAAERDMGYLIPCVTCKHDPDKSQVCGDCCASILNNWRRSQYAWRGPCKENGGAKDGV